MIDRLITMGERNPRIRIRMVDKSRFKEEARLILNLLNDAWSNNWGYVPLTEAEINYAGKKLKPIIFNELVRIAEVDGEPVAFMLTIPDINQVLRKMNGRILPFGWWHYLRRKKIVDRVRVGFLGVKPEYQHTGVAAALYVAHFDESARSQIKWGEMGWILETNRAMNRGMQAMNGRIVKRYRVYERELAAG